MKVELEDMICITDTSLTIRGSRRRITVPSEVVEREIVVVASGCTDTTAEVVKRYMGGTVTVKLVEQEARLGKASALNQAFAVCEGDYVVLVPADVCPAAGALFNLLVPFRDRGEPSRFLIPN